MRAARDANEAMPSFAVTLLEEKLKGLTDLRVAVLGAAYRGGVKETAFSGVFPVVSELRERGAVPSVHDPLYSDDELEALGFTPYALGEPVDAVVLQADHSEYRHLSSQDFPELRAVVDGRSVLEPTAFLGVDFLAIGHPDRRPS